MLDHKAIRSGGSSASQIILNGGAWHLPGALWEDKEATYVLHSLEPECVALKEALVHHSSRLLFKPSGLQ